MALNFKRGLFRLWLIFAVFWTVSGTGLCIYKWREYRSYPSNLKGIQEFRSRNDRAEADLVEFANSEEGKSEVRALLKLPSGEREKMGSAVYAIELENPDKTTSIIEVSEKRILALYSARRIFTETDFDPIDKGSNASTVDTFKNIGIERRLQLEHEAEEELKLETSENVLQASKALLFYVGATFLPPVLVFFVGFALLWAIAGFSRPQIKVNAHVN